VQDPGQAASDRKWWRRSADSQTDFRLAAPVVIFWAWVVLAIVIAAQVAIPDHDYGSLEVTAGLAALTGIAYAAGLRPRVTADDDGVRVHNPFRDHRIGWGGLNAVFLGDSVEFSCARPASRTDKTIYCWALYSGRRSRLRARRRAERDRTRGFGAGASLSGRAPAEAQELTRQDTVQLMAAQISRRSAEARERGAPAAVLESTWAWWPLASVVAPAAVLLGLVLAR
jgi:Bacterial PH domain